MSPPLHERLVQRSVAGRYDCSWASAAGSPSWALILFVQALGGRATADRAWQLFHVNWLYFTGLAGGQRRLRGGAEDHQRQVVGHDHPVRRGVGGVSAGLAARRWC